MSEQYSLDYERGDDVVFMSSADFDAFLTWLRVHGIDVNDTTQDGQGRRRRSRRAILEDRQREADQKLANSEFDLGDEAEAQK